MCSSDLDDEWIAIAVETDDQWRSLCGVAGQSGWLDRFAGDRKAQEDALDETIAGWTAGLKRDVLVERLASVGIIAAPVLNGLEVAHDPVFRERGAIQMIDHPETGFWPQPAIPCQFSKTPAAVTGAAPLKDADSAAVFARLLGMSEDEYERLRAAGVTGVDHPRPE